MKVINTISSKIGTIGKSKTLTEDNLKLLSSSCQVLIGLISKYSKFDECKIFSIDVITITDSDNRSIKVCSTCAIKVLKSRFSQKLINKSLILPVSVDSSKDKKSHHVIPKSIEAKQVSGLDTCKNIPKSKSTLKTKDKKGKREDTDKNYRTLKKVVYKELSSMAISMPSDRIVLYLNRMSPIIEKSIETDVRQTINEFYIDKKSTKLGYDV